jgi:hypothetical protein
VSGGLAVTAISSMIEGGSSECSMISLCASHMQEYYHCVDLVCFSVLVMKRVCGCSTSSGVRKTQAEVWKTRQSMCNGESVTGLSLSTETDEH